MMDVNNIRQSAGTKAASLGSNSGVEQQKQKSTKDAPATQNRQQASDWRTGVNATASQINAPIVNARLDEGSLAEHLGLPSHVNNFLLAMEAADSVQNNSLTLAGLHPSTIAGLQALA